MKVRVGIIMGSSSDWETMQVAADTLDSLSIAHEVRVISAHRTPDLLFEYAASARERGLKAIIAGAGGAAHLPGMTAAKTTVPVLGVPVPTKTLGGIDSLLSIAQMPSGIPVATFAIGTAGARNAALFAVAIIANEVAEVRLALDAFRSRKPPRCSTNPIRASLEILERRHRRCGSAGAHDGARRLPLGSSLHFPRSRARRRRVRKWLPFWSVPLEDAALLEKLASQSDVLTFDWENIAGRALASLERLTPSVRRGRRSRFPKTGSTRRPCSSA